MKFPVSIVLACAIAFGIAAARSAQLRAPLGTAVLYRTCGSVYDGSTKAVPAIFYEGEPVVFGLEVGNSDALRRHDLVWSSSAPEFRVRAVSGEAPDMVPLTVDLRLSRTITHHYNWGSGPIEWRQRVTLDPLHSLVWDAELLGISEPGVYSVDLVPAAADETGGDVRGGRLSFEWRKAESSNAAEITRRRACSALRAGELDEAYDMARLLLMQYPVSAQAHVLLASIAEQRGMESRNRGNHPQARLYFDDAIRHWQTAVDLVTSGADELLLRFATGKSHGVDANLAGWQARIEALR